MLVYFGTFLEFFEFMLFVSLFPVLSQTFQDHFSNEQQATLSYFLFWVGFIARPLGAYILGPIGDQKSRKKLLIISIIGMSVTSMIMGCVPIYVHPMITISFIVILRLLQGFFTGVEFSTATLYVFENTEKNQNQHHRILMMGMMTTLGMACAYLIGALCHLEVIAFLNFWRAAFLLTGFLSLWVGLLRLTRLPETYTNTPKEFKNSEPFSLQKYVFIFFLFGMSYGPFYYIAVFLNTYGIVLNKTDAFSGLLFNTFISLFYTAIIFVIFKYLHPLFYKKKFISLYHVLFILLLYPLSVMIFSEHQALLIFSYQAVLIFISQLITTHIQVNLPNLFSLQNRSRGYALCQTLAASIIGGGAPMICHQFASMFGHKSYSALYPIGICCLSLLSYKKLKNRFYDDIKI